MALAREFAVRKMIASPRGRPPVDRRLLRWSLVYVLNLPVATVGRMVVFSHMGWFGMAFGILAGWGLGAMATVTSARLGRILLTGG